MLSQFAVSFRGTEDQADLTVAVSVSAEGVGSALYLVSSLLGSRSGALAGLLFVGVGAAALFAHLGHPLRFWRVVSRASTAWISRGALSTTALLLAGASSLLVPDSGLPGLLLRSVSELCALVVMLYAGVFYSAMSSIPFWNTPLLPLVFAIHSLTSGAVVLLGLLSFSSTGAAYPFREIAAVVALLLVCLAATWLFANRGVRSAAARESVRRLTERPLGVLFQGGAVWTGLVAPLALIALALLIATTAPVSSSMLLFVAMLTRLAGDFAFRCAVIRAGVHEPVI